MKGFLFNLGFMMIIYGAFIKLLKAKFNHY